MKTDNVHCFVDKADGKFEGDQNYSTPLTCKTFCFREQFNENISTKASEKYYRRIINIHLSDSENVKLIHTFFG